MQIFFPDGVKISAFSPQTHFVIPHCHVENLEKLALVNVGSFSFKLKHDKGSWQNSHKIIFGLSYYSEVMYSVWLHLVSWLINIQSECFILLKVLKLLWNNYTRLTAVVVVEWFTHCAIAKLKISWHTDSNFLIMDTCLKNRIRLWAKYKILIHVWYR